MDDASNALRDLMTAIDDRRWSELSDYLHPDFVCRYMHTGEYFDRDQWIRVNAEYPGFDRLLVQELVGDAQGAACRSHVTSKVENGHAHYECATFVHIKDGLIDVMTEVWTDVEQSAPTEKRPRDLAG